MKIDLLDIFYTNKLNYEEIFKELYFKNLSKDKFDISVIIPVRGRLEFVEPVYRHLIRAIKASPLKICVTYVEHSILSEHLRNSPESYIWVPCNTDSKFNKCLCFNIGVLKGNDADNYLFLDSDLLVPEDFFLQVEKNLSLAMQTFNGRRVLYANEKLSVKFLAGSFSDDSTGMNHPDITIGQAGAPGGAILTSKKLFYQAGGYDAEFFHGYSIEDQFFYNKVLIYEAFKSLPDVELIHLNHGNTHAKTEDFHMNILHTFDALSFGDRKAFVEVKAEYFDKLKMDN